MSYETEVAALTVAVNTVSSLVTTLDTTTKSAYNVAVATAQTHAGTALTHANTAATQVGLATTQASTATTQAGIATTKAGEASTSAATASAAATSATNSNNTATMQATSAANSAATATTQASTATTQASLATTQAGIAAAQATAAAASALVADAILWVSGTTYAIGNARYSPTNGQTYRRLTAGAGTTDPASDTTNWVIVNGITSQAISILTNNLPNIRPSLDLDFANGQTVDPRITFTRASTATRTNSRGLIEAVASGVPRIDFDPVTGVCKGLLIEEQRANQLLNSTIDGANLATQSVTVLAVQQTLSFYGTGTITLSGVYAGTLVGSGVYPARSTLTFTPTAGTLTFTVTGAVQFANFEIGASNTAAPFPTSYIPTAASQVTRAADVATMTGANFSSWYRQDEGSFVVGQSISPLANRTQMALSLSDGTANNTMYLGKKYDSATAVEFGITSGGAGQAFVLATPASMSNSILSGAYKVNDIALSSGTAAAVDTSAVIPIGINTLNIGLFVPGGAGQAINGHLRSLSYYPKRLTNAELVALSTQ